MLGCGPALDADAMEIAVLRHQLAVRWMFPRKGRDPRGLDEQVVALVVRLAPVPVPDVTPFAP